MSIAIACQRADPGAIARFGLGSCHLDHKRLHRQPTVCGQPACRLESLVFDASHHPSQHLRTIRPVTSCRQIVVDVPCIHEPPCNRLAVEQFAEPRIRKMYGLRDQCRSVDTPQPQPSCTKLLKEAWGQSNSEASAYLMKGCCSEARNLCDVSVVLQVASFSRIASFESGNEMNSCLTSAACAAFHGTT